jgi:L-asparaginase
MLRLSRCRLDVSITTLMMFDGLNMTLTDRLLILEQCRQAAENHIVITHGTDTMIITAQLLATVLPNRTQRTIVLTGAMVPYAFGSSDELFNLGSAPSFVQILSPGIYAAMNGRCFSWDNVRKDREKGVFEPL